MDERPLAPGAEVARENVPVERVDGRPGPTAAGEHGGDPPGRARLCRVGVEDVCAAPRHGPPELAHRRGVRERGQLTLECRQADDRNAEIVGDVLHRLLALRQGAGDDDDLVTACPLPGRELDDVQRRAADVEPGDRVHDREVAWSARRSSQLSARRLPDRAAQCAESAPTSPNVSQKSAAIGVPPKSAEPAIAPSERRRATATARYAASSSRSPRGQPRGRSQRVAGRDATSSASEQREPDDAELVGDLVEGLLRDERACRRAGSSVAG